MSAARCSCGAAVLDVADHVLAGFLADHTAVRRTRCQRIGTGADLEAADRALAGELPETIEQLSLFGAPA